MEPFGVSKSMPAMDPMNPTWYTSATSSECLLINARFQPGWFVLAAATVLRIIARCLAYHVGFIGSIAGIDLLTPKGSIDVTLPSIQSDGSLHEKADNC